MPIVTHCSTCDSPLPPGSPGGHCPRCLVALTLNADMPTEETAWVTLAGCELYEEIGRGGMGVVYRARQKALNRIVAVKMLLRAQFASEDERERFHREAQAAARLKHPGIVGIFDVGEDDGVPWFSMEHIAGLSLEQVVREHPMEGKAAAQCVKQVAEALQHAHDNGVLHRDLKPSNILLDDSDRPRITDFGIARLASSDTTTNRIAAELTRTGQMLGSPGYAAPEQALNGHADVRTDVYGLGSLLYHLLTGRPPFQGPTLDAILVQLRDSDALSPRRLNPSVPRDLETICLKCLRKQPEGRYASAAAVAEDLARFLDGKPILARPLNPLGKAWRWAKRSPALASMIIITALLIVAVVGGSLAFARHQARLEHRASLLAEARALRQQHLAGARNDALDALRQAWAIKPSDELRNEVIACLALPELAPVRRLAKGNPAATAPDPTRSTDGLCVARFEQKDIVVRELATKKETGRLMGHKPGSLMKLNDHGTRLAIAAPQSGALQLINVADGHVLATCVHPLPLQSLDWSGDLIATGCENRFIYIWDDQGRLKHRLSGHEAMEIRVSFRPRSQELASTSDDTHVRLWHTARGVEILRREETHDLYSALWWSADGKRLQGANRDHSADMFSYDPSLCFAMVAPPQEEPHSENLGSAAFSRDGELAAVIDELECRLWDFRTGRQAASFPKEAGQWLSALFAPNGHRLWLAGWDQELIGHALSRDAQGSLQCKPATPLMLNRGSLLRGASRDGTMLALSNNGDGEFIVTWPDSKKAVHLKHPGTLATAIDPDGAWIVTTSYKTPGARIWSLPDGKLLRTLCDKDTVMQALVTPDGQRLILQTSGVNHVFRTSDWSDGILPDKLRLAAMTMSSDGRHMAIDGDSDIRILNADTFKEAFRIVLPDYVGWLGEAHLSFDGDGSHLLIHTALGSVVRWDMKAMRDELAEMGMSLQP